MDKTDRISFSKSFDLGGQNKLLKVPGQIYIAKNYQHRSLFGRFVVDFGIFWRSFGDDLDMFWVIQSHVLAWKNRLI